MARATGFYPVGWGFESLRGRHAAWDSPSVALALQDVPAGNAAAGQPGPAARLQDVKHMR